MRTSARTGVVARIGICWDVGTRNARDDYDQARKILGPKVRFLQRKGVAPSTLRRSASSIVTTMMRHVTPTSPLPPLTPSLPLPAVVPHCASIFTRPKPSSDPLPLVPIPPESVWAGPLGPWIVHPSSYYLATFTMPFITTFYVSVVLLVSTPSM